MTRPGREPDDGPRGRLDPAPDPALDARVRAVLDNLSEDGRIAMQAAGRRICDQLAEQVQRRRDLREASHEISAGMSGRTGEHVSYHEMAIRRAGGRADGPDDRLLAHELGRERLQRMLRVLDTAPAGREQTEPCRSRWTGEEWAAPELCRRGPHEPGERHRALSGVEWADEDVALPSPREQQDDDQADELVQERTR